MDENLAKYKIPETAKILQEFVDDMSNWYVRRTRERFWAKGMEQDKVNAYMTLYTALVTLSKMSAPLIPFMTEQIYQNLVAGIDKNAPISVHLCAFPEVQEGYINTELEQDMSLVLEVATLARSARNTSGIKNRQPLSKLYVKVDRVLSDYYTEIIAD